MHRQFRAHALTPAAEKKAKKLFSPLETFHWFSLVLSPNPLLSFCTARNIKSPSNATLKIGERFIPQTILIHHTFQKHLKLCCQLPPTFLPLCTWQRRSSLSVFKLCDHHIFQTCWSSAVYLWSASLKSVFSLLLCTVLCNPFLKFIITSPHVPQVRLLQKNRKRVWQRLDWWSVQKLLIVLVTKLQYN